MDTYAVCLSIRQNLVKLGRNWQAIAILQIYAQGLRAVDAMATVHWGDVAMG